MLLLTELTKSILHKLSWTYIAVSIVIILLNQYAL